MGSPRTCLTLSFAPQGAQSTRSPLGALRGRPDLNQSSARRGTRLTAPQGRTVKDAAACPCSHTVAPYPRDRKVRFGKGKAPPPTLTRVPACMHLTNEKIRRLTKAARREGDFAPHTDRYRRDAVYAARCKAVEPHPTPEWLQYTSLERAREDGEDVYPPSVHSNASSPSRGGR